MLDLERTLAAKVMGRDAELTIQQVSERMGLSIYALRYYERNGLLEPINRAANGHRRYSATDITRIEFLMKLRMTGMPIRQMQNYAISLRQNPTALSERREILEAHERDVQQRIQALAKSLEMIQWKIQNYKNMERQNSTHEITPNPLLNSSHSWN
ncbi:MAG: MerR family transcriptional regulator [Phormidesmis sp. CAN_BIN44]|nr:MerR family transcriptional regulator [Phormidesmis sp. CAN_BIN44]